MAKTNNNSTISRRLKVIGGGLLLLSFIVQNFIYDYWDKKSDEYLSVNRDFSDMSRSSMLYLNLFFNANIENDIVEAIVKRQYINMAAQKQALGQTIEIMTRDIDKQAKIDLCNSLLQSTKTVSDYNSYLDFNTFVNQANPYNAKDSVDRVEKINNSREASRWIFLFSYILGTIILLQGIKYESPQIK